MLSVRPELLCRIRAVIVKGLSLMLAKQARGAPCAPGSVYVGDLWSWARTHGFGARESREANDHIAKASGGSERAAIDRLHRRGPGECLSNAFHVLYRYR